MEVDMSLQQQQQQTNDQGDAHQQQQQQQQQVTNSGKLFVGQVPAVCTEDMLMPLFQPYGTILEVKIMRDHQGRSKGCAWVRYETQAMAQGAIDALHEKHTIPPQTNALRVQFAFQSRPHAQRPQGGYSNGFSGHAPHALNHGGYGHQGYGHPGSFASHQQSFPAGNRGAPMMPQGYGGQPSAPQHFAAQTHHHHHHHHHHAQQQTFVSHQQPQHQHQHSYTQQPQSRGMMVPQQQQQHHLHHHHSHHGQGANAYPIQHFPNSNVAPHAYAQQQHSQQQGHHGMPPFTSGQQQQQIGVISSQQWQQQQQQQQQLQHQGNGPSMW